jgi:cob(I)alamin adenosyltransferase
MTELATPSGRAPLHRIESRHVERLEHDIDEVDALSPPLRNFVLPHGAPAGAELHVLRTVARRAERELWALQRSEPVSATLLEWVNRLSDLLFAMARAAQHSAGAAEIAPDYDV